MTAATTLLVHGARVVTDGVELDEGWILGQDGVIVGVGSGSEAPPVDDDATVVDAQALAGPGAVVTPGFIDIHGHGGGTFAYDDGVEAIRGARRTHLARGTTRAVLSLVTAPVDVLVDRVRLIAELTRTDPTILGSHLEGPFLDVGHKGAHTPGLLRAPDAGSLDALLAAGDGTVRQVTLAPELPGGLEAIRRIVDAGAAAAVGHTDADRATAQAAFDAGATVLTHAFNAMNGLHHREPGPVGAAIVDPRVYLEVIADGVHVHPSVIRMLTATAPDRVALITDAMAAAGASDGAYELGGLAVTVTGGVARLTGGGAIAGSTLTQDTALRVTVDAGMPLPLAVRALTATPAAAIGRDDLGSLAPGYPADLVVLDEALEVRGVWVAGARV